jgi:hypothetical protein
VGVARTGGAFVGSGVAEPPAQAANATAVVVMMRIQPPRDGRRPADWLMCPPRCRIHPRTELGRLGV